MEITNLEGAATLQTASLEGQTGSMGAIRMVQIAIAVVGMLRATLIVVAGTWLITWTGF